MDKRLVLFCVFVVALGALSTEAKSANQWKSRTVYQIMTDRFATSTGTTAPCKDISKYCGGTWRGIQNHLDYIQGMGFDAIWISPVVKNSPDGYHGFWLEDLTKVNEHFGTEAELRSLIDAVHARGMYMMVDVVANHVGPVGYDYRSIVQFKDPSYYHNCNNCPADCTIHNWQNQLEVETCRLAGLPDLNQTVPYVSDTLLSWIKTLVTKYQFDGLRVDTVPEVSKDFWWKFASAAGVFTTGEVFDGRVDYLAGYAPPLDSVLSYPLYFTLKDVFAGKNSMYAIRGVLDAYSKKIRDPGSLGTFLDNHDNPRFLSIQSDTTLYRAALAFTLMTEGIPIVYYGTEQGFHGAIDPANREPLWTTGFSTAHPLYQFLKTTINIRKSYKVWQHPHVERYIDNNFYAFTRGDVLIATTNVGSNGETITRQITFHPYSVGTKLCNVFWNGDCVTVTAAGFPVVLTRGETKIFVPTP